MAPSLSDVATLTDGFSTRRIDWLVPENKIRYRGPGKRGILSPPSKVLLTGCTLLQMRSHSANLCILTHCVAIVPLKVGVGNQAVADVEFFGGFAEPLPNLAIAAPLESYNSIRVRVCKPPQRFSSPPGEIQKSMFLPTSAATAPSPRSQESYLNVDRKIFFTGQRPSNSASSPMVASVEFEGPSLPLRNLFDEGDMIALRYPNPSRDAAVKSVRYDPETFDVFLSLRVKEEDAIELESVSPEGEAIVSKWKVPKSEQGVLDLSYLPESIRLRDIFGRQAVGFAILGRILRISPNMGGSATELKHVVRVAELERGLFPVTQATPTPATSSAAGTICIDITLVGEKALDAITARHGHIVYFNSIATAPSTSASAPERST